MPNGLAGGLFLGLLERFLELARKDVVLLLLRSPGIAELILAPLLLVSQDASGILDGDIRSGFDRLGVRQDDAQLRVNHEL